MIFKENLLKQFYNNLKEEYPNEKIKFDKDWIFIYQKEGAYICRKYEDSFAKGVAVEFALVCDKLLSRGQKEAVLEILNEVISTSNLTAVITKENGKENVWFTLKLELFVKKTYNDKNNELKLGLGLDSYITLKDAIDDLIKDGTIEKINKIIK